MIDLLGPTSHVYISQRLRLHYVDWGNETAPPLLLIHGGRDHSRSWDWLAQSLRRDYHVIAPDLRGHGDSAWSPDGNYAISAFVYDLAQLIHQQQLTPVTIIAHSMGGMIALRYAGSFPETVIKLIAIEGLANLPPHVELRRRLPIAERMRSWIEDRRSMSARIPKRYATIEDALRRMRDENRNLTEEQARHLTIHAVSRNEDGSYSWKFDPYIRSAAPVDISEQELHALWAEIRCPTLLAWGSESWARNPTENGMLAHFRDARVATFEKAAHWLHHDQFETFVAIVQTFLKDVNDAG